MELKVYKVNGADVLTRIVNGKFYYKVSDLGSACGYVRGSNFNLKLRTLSRSEYIHDHVSGTGVYFIDLAGFKKIMPKSCSRMESCMTVLKTLEKIESGELLEVSYDPVFSDLIPEETETEEKTEVQAEEQTEISETLVRLRDIIREKDEIIAELGRKAAYYDICLNSPELLSVTTIACDYGMTAKKLNETLGDLGVQFKDNNGDWQLYAKYIDKGYQATKVMSRLSRDGTIHTTTYKCWTQKGRNFIFDILHENGIFTSLELNELEGESKE